MDDEADEDDNELDILHFNTAHYQAQYREENSTKQVSVNEDEETDKDLPETREELFEEYKYIIKGKKASEALKVVRW